MIDGILKRLMARRMPEADLTKESVSAANAYVKQKGSTLVDHQNKLNWVAAGFSMGVRWKESQLGIKRKDAFGRER